MAISSQDLRAIFLFATLSDKELAIIGDAILAREYPARALVFAQGEPLEGLWIVRSGRVRLYRVSPAGREFTLCVTHRDHLPCMGMCPLFDGKLAPAHAQALEASTVYFVPRARILELAGRTPGIRKLFATVLANHTRFLTERSASLALRCSMDRLNELLLSYADKRGRTSARGIELHLDLTQDMLASVVGATPQALAQAFLRLEQAGVLLAQGKHIVILDRERLAKMV